MDKKTIDYYLENAGLVSSRYETRSLDFLYERIRQVYPPDSRILELGCGTGRDGFNLFRFGFEVFCSDGSISMLRELARFHPQLARRSFLLRLPGAFPLPDHCLDGCIAVAVLMHLSTTHIKEVFREVTRVLKRGGIFMVSIPTKRSGLDERSRDEHGRLYTSVPGSFFSETAREIGLHLQSSFENKDSLNPDGILWTTYQLAYQP